VTQRGEYPSYVISKIGKVMCNDLELLCHHIGRFPVIDA
jgi:hypothetical protein